MNGFQCMECERIFNSINAAEQAMEEGCPKCGGSDIDIATPKQTQSKRFDDNEPVTSLRQKLFEKFRNEQENIS